MYNFFYNFSKKKIENNLYHSHSDQGTPPAPPNYTNFYITKSGAYYVTKDGDNYVKKGNIPDEYVTKSDKNYVTKQGFLYIKKGT